MVAVLHRPSYSLKCCGCVYERVSSFLFRALDRWGRGSDQTGCRCHLGMVRLCREKSRRLLHTAPAQGARRRRETRWRSSPRYWTDSPNSTPPGSYYSLHLLENPQLRKGLTFHYILYKQFFCQYYTEGHSCLRIDLPFGVSLKYELS